MPSIKLRLLRGSLWLALARVLANLIGFLGTLVLARLLVPADFGVVALGTVLLAIANSVTDLSLASALIHLEDPEEEHFHTAWSLNLARSLLVALIFAALSFPLAELYKEPRLGPIMLALSGSIVIGGLNNPRLILFSKGLIFWQEFSLTISAKFVTFAAAVAIAIVYRSYWALVVGTIAGQFAAMVVSYVCIPYRPKLSWKKSKDLWSFSSWLTLAQVVNTINYRFDQMLIGGFLDRAALGYYTVGDNLAALPTREATMPLLQTLFPGFASLNNDRARLQAAYKSAQSMLFCFALPIGFGFALIADLLVRLVMGEKWLPVTLVIQALSCVFALQTLTNPIQPLALALGETRKLFQRDLWIFLIRIPLVVVGLWLWGLTGVIYARMFSGTVGVLMNLQLADRLVGVPLRVQLISNTRSLLSVVAMIVTVIGVRAQMARPQDTTDLVLAIALLITVGVLTYIGTHVLLWLAARRPSGPESHILEMLTTALNKISNRQQSA